MERVNKTYLSVNTKMTTEEEKKCKQRNIYKFVQSRETDVLEVGTSSNKKGGHCHSSCTLSKLIDKIKILSA